MLLYKRILKHLKMKQIRMTIEDMNKILLLKGFLVENEIISEVTITKSNAIVFNIVSELEKEFLSLILINTGLPDKVSKPLWLSGRYKNLGDVIKSTEKELLRVPNFGKVLLKELNFFLLTKGLKLKEEE